jgi:hypothetical protein
MGHIGPCCCGCYEIPDAELPTITKSGWTAGSWSVGPCCRCIELTPDTPLDYSYCCTDYFAEKTLTSEATTLQRAYRTQKPKTFPLAGGSLTEEYCCDGEPFTVATINSTEIGKLRYKLLTRMRYVKIIICISKSLVTCGEDAPVTKWIVHSRYIFEWTSWATIARDVSVTNVRTIESGTCFVSNASPSDCSFTAAAPCHPDDFLDVVPGATGIMDELMNYVQIGGGISWFSRVKFYDTLPESLVTFTNSDKGDDCTWPSCGVAEGMVDSFCVDVTSLPSFINSCMCNKSRSADTTTTTYNLLSSCCFVCEGIPGAPITGTTIQRCDGEISYNDCFEGCQFTPCTTATYNETVADGSSVYSNATWTPCGTNWYQEFGSCSGSSLGSMRIKTCAEDSSCYWPDICNGGCGPAKYQLMSTYLSSASISADCDFTSRSCCFSAPSWSVVFG